MASIHRDPRGKSPFWYAAFTLPDKTRCFKSTKSKDRKQAMAMAIELESLARDAVEKDPMGAQVTKLARELYERVTGNRVEIVHVGPYLTSWAERMMLLKSKGTAVRYGQVIGDFLRHLGEPRLKANLGSVTTQDLQTFVAKELQDGKSETTVSLATKILRIPFNAALRQGLILRNPVSNIETPHAISQIRKPFTWSQVKQLLNTADDSWKLIILLGGYCGMRISDCVNLKWTNVDLQNGVIKFIPRKTLRTRKELTIAIHDSLKDYLNALEPKKDFVVPMKSRKSTGGESGLSTTFINVVMKKAGIDPEPTQRTVKGKGRIFHQLSFHSLRHTFNTELANKGISQELRKLLVGHSSNAVNDNYSKFSTKTLKKAVSVLPSHQDKRT